MHGNGLKWPGSPDTLSEATMVTREDSVCRDRRVLSSVAEPWSWPGCVHRCRNLPGPERLDLGLLRVAQPAGQRSGVGAGAPDGDHPPGPSRLLRLTAIAACMPSLSSVTASVSATAGSATAGSATAGSNGRCTTPVAGRAPAPAERLHPQLRYPAHRRRPSRATRRLGRGPTRPLT